VTKVTKACLVQVNLEQVQGERDEMEKEFEEIKTRPALLAPMSQSD
jgi:hypothetical protein